MINSWENYIEKAKKLFLSKAENEIITHRVIETRIGIDKEQSSYLYVIKKAKDMLLDMGIVIKSVPRNRVYQITSSRSA